MRDRQGGGEGVGGLPRKVVISKVAKQIVKIK